MLPRLRQLRQEQALSQQQLANRLGLSQQSINKYENHKVEPDISTLCKMADLFGTTIDYIVNRSNDRIPPGQDTPPGLTRTEYELLSAYRQLNAEEAQSIDLVLKNYLLHKP